MLTSCSTVNAAAGSQLRLERVFQYTNTIFEYNVFECTNTISNMRQVSQLVSHMTTHNERLYYAGICSFTTYTILDQNYSGIGKISAELLQVCE